MANPSKSNPTPRPPALEDPYEVRETFATEVAVGVIGKGVLRLTFAVDRVEAPRPNEAPQPKRVIVSRLILDGGGARQLWDYLQRLNLVAGGTQPPQGAAPQKPN
jgi:hypothetical protein